MHFLDVRVFSDTFLLLFSFYFLKSNIAIAIVQRAISIERAINKRSKQTIPKIKKIKGDNCIRNKRCKFNIAITLLGKITILGALILFLPTILQIVRKVYL